MSKLSGHNDFCKTFPGSARGKLLLAGVLVLACVLRLWQLGRCQLWYDEVCSVLIARDVFGSTNPPLYFWLLNAWGHCFGFSEWSLRLPSVLASLCSIGVLYAIGRRAFDRCIGLWAAGIMAASAFDVWYAQESRPYALCALLGLLASYCLIYIIRTQRARYWLGFILFSVLGLYANITYLQGILFLCQLLVLVVYCGRRVLPRLFLAGGAVFLSTLPLLDMFLWKMDRVSGPDWWVRPPLWQDLVQTPIVLWLGHNLPQNLWGAVLVWEGILLANGIACVVRRKGWRWNLAAVTCVSLIPMLLVYAVSVFFYSIYLPRAFIIFAPYCYLLLAAGLCSARGTAWKTVSGLVTAALLASGLAAFYADRWPESFQEKTYGVQPKTPVTPLLDVLARDRRPGDIVAHTHRSTLYVFYFYLYLHGTPPAEQYLLAEPDSEKVVASTEFAPGMKKITLPQLRDAASGRLWLVFSTWERRLPPTDIPVVKQALEPKWRLRRNLNAGGVWLFEFEAARPEPSS